MSDSFLPPVMVELGATDTQFLKAFARSTATLEKFSAAAKMTAAEVDKSFSSMVASAESLGGMAESVAAVKKEMQGYSRASNAVAKATDKAAAATGAAMATISDSAERMAEAVGAAAATADTSIATLGATAQAAATGLKVTSEESVAAGASMERAGAQAEGMGVKFLGLGPVFDKVKKWGSIGLAGVGIASVLLATKFQTQMTRLSTAAGAPAVQVAAMRSEVLKTATSVGVSGTQMAEALYHPVSAGLDLKTSLQAVKYAAEEAQISGAKLDDTTYALSSVMKAFNYSAADAGPTMASLNAIVGQGDMRFQDFNESVKNWAPTAAQMGISVNSMGSGLAYLTDRGNSAEVAATRLTMGISMMTTPSAKATKMLTAMGLASTDVKASSGAMESAMTKAGVTQNQLAMDLKKPDGLYVALNHLKTSLKQAGVSGTEADSVLSKIFGGGRSDKAVMSLMQDLGGLKTKYDAITKDSSAEHFQAAWQKTTKTLRYQFDQIKSGAENLGIRIGDSLIPQVSKFLGLLETRGAPVVKSIGSALSGFASGFTGSAGKTSQAGRTVTTGGGQQHGGAVAAPELSGWQKAGEAIRGVASDFAKFGGQVSKAFTTLMHAAGPALAMLAGIGVGTLVTLGQVLSTVVGPALDAVSNALDRHRTLIEAVVLGLVMYKAMIITTTVVTKTIEIATKAWAAAQAILNAVMEVNPAVLIIAGIVALVAMVIYAYNHFSWFRTGVQAAFHGITEAVMFVVDFVKAHWLPILAIITGPVGLAVGLVIKYWSQISGGVMAAVNAVVGFVKSHWPLLLGILTGPIGLAVYAIVHYWGQISAGFSSAYRAVVSTGKSLLGWVIALPGRILAALGSLGASLYTTAHSAFERFMAAQTAVGASILSWIKGLPGRITSTLGNLGSLLYSAGSNLIHGFLNGIDSAFGSVKSKLSDLTSMLPSWKGPPARDKVLLHDAGQMIIDGLVAGMGSRFGSVQKAAGDVAKTTVSSFSAALEINSPSKKFASLGAYVMDGLMSGLTGSTARVRAATEHIARSLYVDFGSSHRSLQRGVARDNSELMSLAKRRDSVAARLKAAQKGLAAVQKTWTSEKGSVAAGIMQNASIITQSPDAGRAVNSDDVLANMRAQVQAATQFAANLDQLRKKGLSSALITQLASAGVDQAGATAQALAAGSKGQIQQMNAMQSSLQSAANSTGTAVANSMYGAGLKSAQGLVKGLKSQEKAIEAQMMRIAKSMQAAIKRALGIRSPSTVMAQLGDYTAQGMAVGINRSGKQAAVAARGMAMSVAQSAALRPGAGGFGLGGMGGGGVVNYFHAEIKVEGSVLSEKKLGDVVEEQFLRKGMRRSTTYQNYKRG